MSTTTESSKFIKRSVQQQVHVGVSYSDYYLMGFIACLGWSGLLTTSILLGLCSAGKLGNAVTCAQCAVCTAPFKPPANCTPTCWKTCHPTLAYPNCSLVILPSATPNCSYRCPRMPGACHNCTGVCPGSTPNCSLLCENSTGFCPIHHCPAACQPLCEETLCLNVSCPFGSAPDSCLLEVPECETICQAGIHTQWNCTSPSQDAFPEQTDCTVQCSPNPKSCS